MSAEDPTYEEVWREFHNFTFQTLPNLDRLKAPLKKAADAEKFLAESASIVAQKQEHVDYLTAQENQKQIDLLKAEQAFEELRNAHKEEVEAQKALLTELSIKINETNEQLNAERSAKQREIQELEAQRQGAQATVEDLAKTAARQRQELEDLRTRIATAVAALK